MLANQSGIYAITNTVNGKMYLGSAVNFRNRWGRHRSAVACGYHHSEILQRAWAKYGPDAFTFDVVEFVDRPRLIEREQVWIDFFKPAYNIAPTAGSTLGCQHTPEARSKMRAAATGRITSAEIRAKMSASRIGLKHSPETREKIRAARMGKKHSPETIEVLTGKKRSPETRANISAGITGRPVSAETRAKLSAALTGRQFSAEHRAKVIAANTGKKRSPETRAKMSRRALTPEVSAKLSAAANRRWRPSASGTTAAQCAPD